jgi:hypothetical protein
MLEQTAKPQPKPLKLVAWECSEFAVQCSLVDALRKFAAPDRLWLHIGNGERRDAITGSRLKRRCCPNQRVIRTVVGLNAERVRQCEATYWVCAAYQKAIAMIMPASTAIAFSNLIRASQS